MSPHSIATLLALLQQGATGATLEQLSVALQMSQQGSAAAFKAYSDDVQVRPSFTRFKLRRHGLPIFVLSLGVLHQNRISSEV